VRESLNGDDGTIILNRCQRESAIILHDSEIEINKRHFSHVLGLTREKNAARLAKRIGVVKSTAYGWERGDRPIPQKQLKAISETYHIALDDLYISGAAKAEDKEESHEAPPQSDFDKLGCEYFSALPDDVKPYALRMLKSLQSPDDEDLPPHIREVKENLARDRQLVQDYAGKVPYARERSASKGRKPKDSKPSPNKD